MCLFLFQGPFVHLASIIANLMNKLITTVNTVYSVSTCVPYSLDNRPTSTISPPSILISKSCRGTLKIFLLCLLLILKVLDYISPPLFLHEVNDQLGGPFNEVVWYCTCKHLVVLLLFFKLTGHACMSYIICIYILILLYYNVMLNN